MGPNRAKVNYDGLKLDSEGFSSAQYGQDKRQEETIEMLIVNHASSFSPSWRIQAVPKLQQHREPRA